MKWTLAASFLLRRHGQDKRWEGSKKIVLAASIAAITAVNCAHAATITVKTPGNGTPIVLVTGRFRYGDEIDFKEKTDSLSKAIVSFESPGGNAPVGITIGRAIRAKRFVTFVGDTQCSSACAAAWLGGVKRYMTPNSHIGFHAVYNASTHLESGSGNAAFGAYLNEIGLPERAVEWISDKGPDDINLLTKPIADMIGIDVEIYHETTSTAINTPPAQLPSFVAPATPAPASPDADGPPLRFLYRGRPFSQVHLAPFVYPLGWAYRRWGIGAVLPPLFLAPAYYYSGWAAAGLPPPQPGFQWLRYGPDLLLVNVTTGQVVDAIYGEFY